MWHNVKLANKSQIIVMYDNSYKSIVSARNLHIPTSIASINDITKYYHTNLKNVCLFSIRQKHSSVTFWENIFPFTYASNW